MKSTRTTQNIVSLDVGAKSAALRYQLIGTTRVTDARGVSLLPRGRKSRAVLAYLACHCGKRVLRARLAALLWDRVPEQQGRASLRQAIHEITGCFSAVAPDHFSADSEALRLDPRACWIDSAALLAHGDLDDDWFDRLPDQGIELMVDLDGLSTAFDEWLTGERMRFADGVVDRLDRVMAQAAVSAAPPRRLALARKILSFDPAHERAFRTAIQALADMGERGAALTEYERCKSVLRARLDIEPSAETTDLAARIRSGQSTQNTPVRPADAVTPTIGSGRIRIDIRAIGSSHDGPHRSTASLVQELRGALSRFRSLELIAGPPSGQSTDVPTIADYVISIEIFERSGAAFDVSTHVVSVAQMRQIWNDRVTGVSLGQLDAMQALVGAIAARTETMIRFEEARACDERMASCPLRRALKAASMMQVVERATYEAAGRLLEETLREAPTHPAVLT